MTECPACAEMLFPLHARCTEAREQRDLDRRRRIEGYIRAGEDVGRSNERYSRRVRVETRVEEIRSGCLT